MRNFRFFQNDNFRFDENGRKFSKGVENVVGKGQILLFPTFCFSKDSGLYDRQVKKKACLGKGLKPNDKF